MLEGISRRHFMAAIPLLTLVACGENDSIVTVTYRPLVNFMHLRFGQQPAQTFESGPGRLLSMVEIVRVSNAGPNAKPFEFDAGHVGMKDAARTHGWEQYLPDLNYGFLKDMVPAGQAHDYPRPEPIVSGPWCQTRQHARMLFTSELAAAGDETTVGQLTYPTPGSNQKVVMAREQPIKPVPFYDEISVGQMINTIFAGTFLGNCSSGGAPNPGGGGNPDPGGGNPNPGGGGGGGDQTYTFCVIAPVSGAQKQEISVVANSPSAAMAKLKAENLPNGGIGWGIASGPCT